MLTTPLWNRSGIPSPYSYDASSLHQLQLNGDQGRTVIEWPATSACRDQLDCRDRSFNRIGDTRVPGNVSRGWQPVENDPTALAVAQTWCPRIKELSRRTGEH